LSHKTPAVFGTRNDLMEIRVSAGLESHFYCFSTNNECLLVEVNRTVGPRLMWS